MEQLIAEAYRLRLLSGLEDLLGRAGYIRVAGVDEVGRGCLAGPVVAAAVVPDLDRLVPGVDDSKRLTAERREWMAAKIRSCAYSWSVASVSPATIDRINILQATRKAMVRALDGLQPQPDCALVDAVSIPARAHPCLPVIRGDSFAYSIACASILAKVERDRFMRELGREYPQYGFSGHKGYAAEHHLLALREFGPCPEHRLTFRSVVPRRRGVRSQR